MKIFIDDGMRIPLGTGIGKYTTYLYEALCKIDNIQVELSHYNIVSKSRIYKRLRYLLHINSPKYYKNIGNYDVAHFTGHYFPFVKNKKVKYVATVHDIVAFKHPETLNSISRMIAKYKIRRIIKSADVVLTVSQSVKKEIDEVFPKYKSKVFSIYPGNYDDIKYVEKKDIFFSNEKLKALNEMPYFLFVGTVEKRKNIGLIIDAYIKLKENEKNAHNYKLVLAGRAGYGYEEFLQKVNSSNYQKDVIFTGFITDEERNMLYSKAAAYIFPSIYEGFGSTQLECMTCHTPLILSDIVTNREVSGEYGLFFKLDDIESLISQMQKIVQNDYDKNLHDKIADDCIKNYDWNKLVFKYVDIYNNSLAKE